MASVINIQGTTAVDDPEYRYKMPSIIGKVEGRGNGIKTAIPNMTQVALSLHRDPGEVTKFFGCELGAQTTWSPDTERSIVNGAHTTNDLQSNIFKYIEKFVLCPNCRLPETDYKIKNGVIYQTCNACGAKEMVDMSHKLTTYILAQDKKHKKEKKKDKDKDGKKKKKKGDEEDTEKDKKKKKKKDKDDKDKKKKKKKKKSKDEGSVDDDDEDDEEAEGSPAAAAAEMELGDSDDDDDDDDDEEESPSAAAAAGDDGIGDDALDDHESPKAVVTRKFSEYLEANPSASAQAKVDFLRQEQSGAMMPLKECAYIAVAVFFDEHIVAKRQVAANKDFLAVLVSTDSNTFMARHLIGALELFFGGKHVEISKAFPLVLKQLYDEDVLEEEAILAWSEAGVTYDFSPQALIGEQIKDLRNLADPFVNWLQEAEEDSDDEE